VRAFREPVVDPTPLAPADAELLKRMRARRGTCEPRQRQTVRGWTPSLRVTLVAGPSRHRRVAKGTVSPANSA
jgi:hypothetical protein